MINITLLILITVYLLSFSGGTMRTRGEKNNNPGNLRLTSDAWLGLSPVQNDSNFFQFVSPLMGVRALGKTLLTYYNKHGLKTVSSIIRRYAPGKENPTENYIDFVANKMGISPLHMIKADDIPGLMAGIISFENGRNIYSDTLIKEGFRLANE